MGPRLDDSVERVFRLWLELSREEEILRLLELVKRELSRRRLVVNYSVQPKRPEG
jgi:hypothetical protein